MGIRMRDVYAGDFMKSEHMLGANGEYSTMRLTINGARMHEWDDGKKQIVISFKEDDRSLGLNVTNAETLKSLFHSDDSDAWMGKQVELYVDKNVMFGGKKIPAIRIREVGGGNSRTPATVSTKAMLMKAFAAWGNMDTKDPNFIPHLTKFAAGEGVGLASMLEDEAQRLIATINTNAEKNIDLGTVLEAAADAPPF